MTSAHHRDAMNSILRMQNKIQTYAWGSRSSIAKLMKRPHPTDKPEAELWLGAHPRSSSKVQVDHQWHDLDKWIAQSPETILGTHVSKRFNKTLPYLLKILAAAQPLSIQAHPNSTQARKGFERENIKKIQMDADHRNFKDPYHKPEIICALTPFWALCGFRNRRDSLTNLHPLWPDNSRADLEILNTHSIKRFFRNLMTLENGARIRLINQVIEKAKANLTPTVEQQWMIRLQAKYPGDVGVLAPAYLNLIQLQPGEALALGSGQLHAYLEGVGIELMANSDNVLRGGLTPKHVDIHELLSVVTFDTNCPEIIMPAGGDNNEKFYPSRVEEFVLSVIKTTKLNRYRIKNRIKTPEILLCTRGKAILTWQGDSQTMEVTQGQSAFVTAYTDQYTIDGDAVIYKAGVNLMH